jgi:hypothetical protein
MKYPYFILMIYLLSYSNSYGNSSDTTFSKFSLISFSYGLGKELKYHEYDFSAKNEHMEINFERRFYKNFRYFVRVGYIKYIEEGIDFYDAPGWYIEEKHRFNKITYSYFAKIATDINWKYFGLHLGFIGINRELRYAQESGGNIYSPSIGIKVGYMRLSYFYWEITADPLIFPIKMGIVINIIDPLTILDFSIGNAETYQMFMISASHLINRKYYIKASYFKGIDIDYNGFRIMVGYSFFSS